MTRVDEFAPIIGESAAIRSARELVERHAPTTFAVLLIGATGTGKELLARHIHLRSGRPGRFVAVNCGALPREMAEGLLFGYERGAFSGAIRRHRGHVECSDGGTLFLDELLSLPLASAPDTVRGPDVAFIGLGRIADPPPSGYADLAPDLVVEILSPGDRAGEILAKVADWVSAGSRLVSVVDPES